MGKFRPRHVAPLPEAQLAGLVTAITREGLQNPLAEVQHQNQELLRALDELQRRQDDLGRVNRELEETNRGVVALYAELDEKAEHLRRADEMKTRFLSNMSHEFRTPLNSILAIAGLLERRLDGELTPEQARQVDFIVKAAKDLTEMVDDLLDIAKVEAGKIVVRPVEFELPRLFGALRGMLRPLLVSDSVRLAFDDPVGFPRLYGDEGKVSQILRNLLSNALKFTEHGEVRVLAALSGDGERFSVLVSDTGIGIALEDQSRIFDEFGQVEHAVQRKVKGTGLGLALSKRLAHVLGGDLRVESAPGQGSTFTLDLPVSYAPRPHLATESVETDDRRTPLLVVEDDPSAQLVVHAGRVLVIDDDPASRYVISGLLRRLGLLAEEAEDGASGLRRAQSGPAALVLDLVMSGLDGMAVLHRLRAEAWGAQLPVVIASSKTLTAHERRDLETLHAVILSKADLAGPEAVDVLARALRSVGLANVEPRPAAEVAPDVIRGAVE